MHVHRAENGEALVAALAALLDTPLADPFAAEVVAVPAKGVERWLAQRLSTVLGAAPGRLPGDGPGGDGVCAGVVFPSPAAVLDGALRDAVEDPDALEAWDPERSVWPLLEVLDLCAGEPWCARLGAHLDAGQAGRRYAVARRLAELFAAYGRARPALVREWARGGYGAGLPPDLAWQAELWRRLRRRLDRPSPAELLEPALARLRAEPACVTLPERLSVVGATRLSPARLAVLGALAEHRAVHLWLHHPSPAVWAALAADPPAPGPRVLDTSGRRVTHPLLASLGRDLRELQMLLTAAAPGHVDYHHTPRPGAGSRPAPLTLLTRLQDDLRHDRVTPPRERPALLPGDRSVVVHACHGRSRQVEVLREVVLGLLADDPTLEPRDVLVMCPDVEAFAPLVAAAFGLDATGAAPGGDAAGRAAVGGAAGGAAGGAGPHPAVRLRVRLADRGLRQANPLLALLGQLLDLAGSRLTASQVLDLAGAPPVRQRFGFADDDLERLRGWVAAAGVRWGLHPRHRAAWQLDGLGQGTWRAGLDRLLTGVAMQEDAGPGRAQWLGSALPLDDVDSGDVDLVGRLAELVDRLDTWVGAARAAHPPRAWVDLLDTTVLDLGAAPASAGWQVTQLQRELAEVARTAGDSPVLLRLADVRALLDRRLAGRPTRASFRTGTLTVCTLTPMRSVPHRVVCLLGLDDGAFPRQDVPDGDDLLAREPRVGERDPRSEDRQLLLDAIGAAGERLVVTCTGADERTGARVPPATPLGELLDALDSTVRCMDGGRVRDVVTVRHPLQPFDPRNFGDGALGPGRFSFDTVALAGARAAAGPLAEPSVFLPAPLPPPPRAGGDVELDALLRLLEHPARGFLRQRLGVVLARAEEESADAVALGLEPLEQWALGDRLLRAGLAGVSLADAREVEARRGDLPPGRLGAPVFDDVARTVGRLLTAVTLERAVPPTSIDVLAGLPGGRRVTGTVPGVRGEVLLALGYSRVAAKHRLRAWGQLLALTVTFPEVPWRAVTVGRRGGDVVGRYLLGPLDEAEARQILADLVALHDEGLRAPLPAPVATAADYARRRLAGASPSDAADGAGAEWEGRAHGGERDDPDNALVWGAGVGLGVLLAVPPQGGPGRGERSRLGQVATQLWDRLLAAETEVRV